MLRHLITMKVLTAHSSITNPYASSLTLPAGHRTHSCLPCCWRTLLPVQVS